MTVTLEAFPVERVRAARPAVAKVEAVLECVPVGVVSAVADLAEQVWGTLRSGCGQ